MGTRSLTIMHEDADEYNGGEIVVMYRQMDGYPSGHGQELRDFLKGIVMVNGIGVTDKRIANGGGCLAALIVSHFKMDDVGGFYLHPAGTRDIGEEYIYHVYPSVKHGNIKVVTESVYNPNSNLDGFGKVWYNDGTTEKEKEKEKKMNDTNEPKEYHLRYSQSKGQFLRVDEMHPCHILNALRKELRQTDNEDVLNDPLFHDYFEVLSKPTE